jgi:hypothetical protein
MSLTKKNEKILVKFTNPAVKYGRGKRFSYGYI